MQAFKLKFAIAEIGRLENVGDPEALTKSRV